MIDDISITQISHIFCGDIEGYYLYKTGAKLVTFFNYMCEREHICT